MTKLGIAKLVINVAAGIGVSKVTNDIITNNVTVNSTEDRIKVAVGSFVLASMVADAASDHVNAAVDSIVKIWKTRKASSPADIAEEIVPAT